MFKNWHALAVRLEQENFDLLHFSLQVALNGLAQRRQTHCPHETFVLKQKCQSNRESNSIYHREPFRNYNLLQTGKLSQSQSQATLNNVQCQVI